MTTSDARTSTAAAPAPNMAHSQAAKEDTLVRKGSTQDFAPTGHWVGIDRRLAVQSPITTPTGTDASRRIFVVACLMRRC